MVMQRSADIAPDLADAARRFLSAHAAFLPARDAYDAAPSPATRAAFESARDAYLLALDDLAPMMAEPGLRVLVVGDHAIVDSSDRHDVLPRFDPGDPPRLDVVGLEALSVAPE